MQNQQCHHHFLDKICDMKAGQNESTKFPKRKCNETISFPDMISRKQFKINSEITIPISHN